jgi:hypothetical protein
MDPSSTDRDALLQQIADKAVVRGRVTLSSGKEADYYVDLRRITLDSQAAPLVGRGLAVRRGGRSHAWRGPGRHGDAACRGGPGPEA